MLIKKFKNYFERKILNKYKNEIIKHNIKLPKTIDKNSIYLIKYKDLNSIIESLIQNIEKRIFYFIIFLTNKNMSYFKLGILKQITDFLGVHLILIGKNNYYIYQNIEYKFQIENTHIVNNIDKRFIYLKENDLKDLSIISYIYLSREPIIFTDSYDEILIQNFVNSSFSICINNQGKIFKPVVFDDVVKLNKNILTINFSEMNILKKKVNQNDKFSKKVFNLLNKNR